MSKWIDGGALAKEIQEKIGAEVQKLRLRGCTPGLAVVLVGEDPASQVYVRNKVRTCQALGMHSEKIELPASASTQNILDVVERLNKRADIHGLLVQIPLPKQVDARRIVAAIQPDKDVDGIHPVNAGRLVAGYAVLRPCTPSGIMEIFKRYEIPLRGSRAVVIGRSEIVGKPLALMLMHADATVTICHSKTRDLPAIAREADILVAAMGKAAFVDASFVKPGATVIDVGVNRLESIDRIRQIFGDDPRRISDHANKGYTLVGDVNPTQVFPLCGYLTPVPGGIGPLTISMLMANTLKAAAGAFELVSANAHKGF